MEKLFAKFAELNAQIVGKTMSDAKMDRLVDRWGKVRGEIRSAPCQSRADGMAKLRFLQLLAEDPGNTLDNEVIAADLADAISELA